jgi:hypothetical protein
MRYIDHYSSDLLQTYIFLLCFVVDEINARSGALHTDENLLTDASIF